MRNRQSSPHSPSFWPSCWDESMRNVISHFSNPRFPSGSAIASDCKKEEEKKKRPGVVSASSQFSWSGVIPLCPTVSFGTSSIWRDPLSESCVFKQVVPLCNTTLWEVFRSSFLAGCPDKTFRPLSDMYSFLSSSDFGRLSLDTDLEQISGAPTARRGS